MVMEGPPEINPPTGSGENVEKESSIGISLTKGINRAKVGHQRWGRLALAVPGGRLARGWPPWPTFGLLESSFIKDFLEFFWIFPAILIFHLFMQCTDKNRKKLALGTRLIG